MKTIEQDWPSTTTAKELHVGSCRFRLKNVKNANLLLQYEECELWRQVYVYYSETKVTQTKRTSSEALIDCVFTCGSSIEDVKVEGITNVYSRPLNCYDLDSEKQYYSAGYTPSVFTVGMRLC